VAYCLRNSWRTRPSASRVGLYIHALRGVATGNVARAHLPV
jgi:hypothetical protein